MRIVRSSSQAMAGISLAIALSFGAMTAQAASTFLLQFGTHDSEQAAEQQWAQLQQQYGEALSPLTLRVAEVNGEYRTQASGVASREAAQAVCSKLGDTDLDCLVVETSMYMPESTAASSSPYAPLAPLQENISVEMVSDDAMEGVSTEDAGLMPQPQIAAAAPTEPVKSSFAAGFLPWLMGDDEEAEEPAPAPVVAVQPTETPRPERREEVTQPAWAEPVDRSAAAQLSESLPAPDTSAAQRPTDLAAAAEFESIIAQPPAAPAPAPAAVAPAAAPAQTMQPQVLPQAPLPEGVSGEAQVEVAEAIQVPLTFGEAAAVPVPANKPVGYGGFPSQPLPARTLWIQLNQFADKDAAMGYWRMLSAQYPEMMRLLRVRIVAPWRSGYGSRNNRASLRMGPFADQNEINNLCSIAAQSNLRCTTVQEVGSTAAANTQRRAASAEMYNRRVASNRAYSTTPAGMYWIQLGAFDNVQAAQQFWGNLQTAHNDLLGRLQPQISYPAMSSSPTPVYHLRSGPFVSQSSAVGLCKLLQNRHAGCIVIQSR